MEHHTSTMDEPADPSAEVPNDFTRGKFTLYSKVERHGRRKPLVAGSREIPLMASIKRFDWTEIGPGVTFYQSPAGASAASR
jgi:hypothetical protein